MSEWDEHAAGWDDDEAVRAYADGAYSSLRALVDGIGFRIAGAAACDFGCGTGLLTERLADECGRIDAVDTSPAMRGVLADKVERRGWRHVRILERLPTEPQGYDLIVCSSVLSFVDDHPSTVGQLSDHLAAGGLFVQWDWEADPTGAEPGGLTAREIRDVLVGAGFEEVAVRVAFDVSVDGDRMRPLMGSGRRPRPERRDRP